jgi:hypothetical protein
MMPLASFFSGLFELSVSFLLNQHQTSFLSHYLVGKDKKKSAKRKRV